MQGGKPGRQSDCKLGGVGVGVLGQWPGEKVGGTVKQDKAAGRRAEQLQK